MSAKVGPTFSKIYSITLFLLIGPLLAIPRTAASTFEISILPNFQHVNQFIFIIIYFAINLIFVLKPTKILEYWKILNSNFITNPCLLLAKGFINPISNFSPKYNYKTIILFIN